MINNCTNKHPETRITSECVYNMMDGFESLRAQAESICFKKGTIYHKLTNFCRAYTCNRGFIMSADVYCIKADYHD